MHSVTTAGSITLPANSRFAGNVTLGTMAQDEPLLPFTINSAIAPIPLPRPTADAKVRTLAMTHTLTSRPTQYVWLNARYRYYDFDNRTPRFLTSSFVGLDSGVRPVVTGGSEPISSTRQSLDLDASFTPIPFTALKVGYGHDSTDRTHRIFARTSENVFRASVDSTKSGMFTFRGIFEHSSRKGSGFEEADLVGIGEQPALRHFDIANRDRNRFTALVQVTPIPQIGLTATAMRGKDDYADSGLGLRDSETRGCTVALDLAPGDKVAGALSYTYDKYTALQNSRQASPGVQFTDPTRDWSVDLGDRTETVSANLDLLKLLPHTDLRLGYEWNRARATYVYGAPPNSTLPAVQQLPPLKNELQIARVDLWYFAKANIAVRLAYGYERYRVEDFSLSPSTIKRIDLPGSLFLGYVYRPYTAHTGWIGVSYLW
jgi:MtrB/PioB family decaheme-associated outer membrane protein